LRKLEQQLASAGYADSSAIAAEAARWYENIAAALGELCSLFPFPTGGSPNDPVQAEIGIQILERVKQEEEAAISELIKLSKGMDFKSG
jgi:hypothetical protein